MEDGDISLQKEIKDLALDHPPDNVPVDTPSLAEDIFQDVQKTENESQDIVSSRLATCLIDKPFVASHSIQAQDVNFDPLSSSERLCNTEEGDNDSATDDRDCSQGHFNEITILHSADQVEPIQVLSSSVNLVSSNSVESKSFPTTCKNEERLVSCMKDDGESTSEKGSSRCVQFTDGPGIVTEYIEPVNPWRDRRTPTKGEVVSIYKNVCKKLKCKPIEKVVKQIQEASDLSTRSGTLILRGCRLDNKSCEALESVFDKVQFENLDLENCSLEEDGATAVLEMIEFYHSTCKLNIACNPKVGLRGWQALCRMLRKTPCLTYLDARRTILTEMTMPTFGRCLKADPYLKVLHLEGVFLSGRPLLILTTALKYNRLLEELYLGDNDLASNDGPSIGAMLTYNTTLQLLDLRNNQIKDIGLAHIGNGLSDQTEQPCGGLCSLIMWNNGLTHEGMTYLCEGLVKTTTLKALNLGQNRIGDLGVQKLKGGLMKNKSLRKLGFLNTKLGSEGAVALAEVLADSWSITRIDIRENNIQTAGLMAFAMALKVNQSLLRLDLDKDIRKEPGMETVMQSVLVDIYNLCHRNKNLVRKNITPSQSVSSCSIGTIVSRQSSTSSEMNEPFTYDDVFHPEEVHSEVTPFSPSVCIENPLESNTVMFSSINSIIASKMEMESSDGAGSLGNPVIEPFDNTKRGRAYSDPIRNNPDPPAPPANGRRSSSRFSVTKIVDMLGTHAQGVASKIAQIDHKLKKQHSKDKIEVQKTPIIDQNQPVEMATFGSQSADVSNSEQTDSSNKADSEVVIVKPDSSLDSNNRDALNTGVVNLDQKETQSVNVDDVNPASHEECVRSPELGTDDINDTNQSVFTDICLTAASSGVDAVDCPGTNENLTESALGMDASPTYDETSIITDTADIKEFASNDILDTDPQPQLHLEPSHCDVPAEIEDLQNVDSDVSGVLSDLCLSVEESVGVDGEPVAEESSETNTFLLESDATSEHCNPNDGDIVDNGMLPEKGSKENLLLSDDGEDGGSCECSSLDEDGRDIDIEAKESVDEGMLDEINGVEGELGNGNNCNLINDKETTLLDSVVRLEHFVNEPLAGSSVECDAGVDGGDGLAPTVVPVSTSTEECGSDGGGGDVSSVPASCLDGNVEDVEPLVPLGTISISEVTLDDSAFEYDGESQAQLTEVETMGMFNQHTLFGQPVEVDLPS